MSTHSFSTIHHEVYFAMVNVDEVPIIRNFLKLHNLPLRESTLLEKDGKTTHFLDALPFFIPFEGGVRKDDFIGFDFYDLDKALLEIEIWGTLDIH